MPQATMKVDFYQVTPPVGMAMSGILTRIATIPEHGSGRLSQLNDKLIRIADIRREAHGAFSGEMIHIRMDQGPRRVSTDGTVDDDFDLGENEGFGESSAFLYQPRNRCLAMQRNRYGVSPGQFMEYIEEKDNMANPIGLQPITQTETAIDRLNGMCEIRKVRLRFAAPETLVQIAAARHGEGWNGLLRIKEQLAAPHVDVVFSVGHRQSPLAAGVRNLLAQIIGIHARLPDNQKLKACEITGRTPEEERDVFNLLNDFVTDEQIISYEGRSVPYALRRLALARAMQRNRDILNGFEGECP